MDSNTRLVIPAVIMAVSEANDVAKKKDAEKPGLGSSLVQYYRIMGILVECFPSFPYCTGTILVLIVFPLKP